MPAPDVCHAMGCDAADGQCKAVAANDGASCVAADKCTVGATCSAGVCNGKPKDCSALDSGPLSPACLVGACDPASGQCAAVAAKDGTPCNAQTDYCSAQSCAAGKCGGGVAVVTCQGGDKCCPVGCSPQNDGDCGMQIAGGGWHTCLRLGDDTAKCWGWGQYGQLGNSSNASSVQPVTVADPSAVQLVAAGDTQSCAVIAGGTARCWGSNFAGELGNGTFKDSNAPVTVMGIDSATAISSGNSVSCAVLGDHTVACWGANWDAQLGPNGANGGNQNTPVLIAGVSDAVAVCAGGEFACALIKAGTVNCWGGNYLGQLGTGAFFPDIIATPNTVKNLSGAVSLACGASHACAVLSDGTAKCWGYNVWGQLGDGTFVSKPSAVQVSTLTSVKSIAAAAYHSCALLADGTARCWGENSWGELGDGSNAQKSSVPVSVAGLSGAVAIAAGGFHTCALLGGGIRCWGYNNYGQLGDGTTTSASVPVAVKGW